MNNKYQIVWKGIIHDAQGYAKASREYLLALDRLGLDIRIEPLNYGTKPTRLLPEQLKRLKELVNKPLAKDKKKVLIYHSQPYGVDADYERRENGYDKVIINTVWETTKVPDQWFPNINKADAVVVPSTQNVQALKDSGVTVPIYMVPHGADTVLFHPDNKPFDISLPDGMFKFLSVFQWQHRKAPEALLRAYFEEFTSQDNVGLITKSYWSGKKEETRHIVDIIRQFKKAVNNPDPAPVFFTGSNFNENEMQGLYRLADTYVLPTRGEGVGLPYMEAMASGVPAIATGWGGQTDFINNSNGYLVDYQLAGVNSTVETGISNHFFSLFADDMDWAEPDVESLRKQMRQAYENREEVQEKGKLARKKMEGMTWDQSGLAFRQTIEEVISS